MSLYMFYGPITVHSITHSTTLDLYALPPDGGCNYDIDINHRHLTISFSYIIAHYTLILMVLKNYN